MLYDIKNNSLKYWLYFDELGNRQDFEFVNYLCACGHDKKKLVGNTTRHRNQYEYYQCQFCGTIRIDPYLTEDSVEKYYSNAYGKIKRQDISAQRLHSRQKKSAKLVWDKVSPFLKNGDKVLDFGGGAGGKVMEILAQHYDVYIKEVDQKYLNYAVMQGLKPYTDGIKFQFIVLSRVLEHMNNPTDFLLYLKTHLLAENGFIYLEVPLIENSRGNSLLNEIHISHKFYFTNLSLKYICHLAGFKFVYESRNLLIITSGQNKTNITTSNKMLELSNWVLANLV